jgi:uncharacterized DUF497 family protein
MQYSWNEEKNRRNLEFHGITFEDAVAWRLLSFTPTERMMKDASFRPGGPSHMNGGTTGRTSRTSAIEG